jgi:hypothetical protein
MKHIIKELQTQPCRVREISDNEINAFESFTHLQRYHPAMEFFNVKELTSQKCIELPSKYVVESWNESSDDNKK